MLKVLVVDDSAPLRKRLKQHVDEVDGVQVVGEAEDGHQALALLEATDPDVVVLDLRMPGLNGFEALDQIKARQPARVVIVMTNYAYPQYREKSLAGGADYFLDKSRDFTMLRQILIELAGGRHAQPAGGGDY